MGALSPVHLIAILVVALLILGPGKLPETGAALGRAIREFRHAVDGTDDTPGPAPSSAGQAVSTPTPAETSVTNGHDDDSGTGLG